MNGKDSQKVHARMHARDAKCCCCLARVCICHNSRRRKNAQPDSKEDVMEFSIAIMQSRSLILILNYLSG